MDSGASSSDFTMSLQGKPANGGFSGKVDSGFVGGYKQSRINAMQNPVSDVSRNFGDRHQHNQKKRVQRSSVIMSAGNVDDDLHGIHQQDPEDPTITGDTNFDKKQNHMD